MKKIKLLNEIAKDFGFKTWIDYVLYADERKLSVVPLDIERAINVILRNFDVKAKIQASEK